MMINNENISKIMKNNENIRKIKENKKIRKI